MDIKSIRESERNSHIELYSSEELYKEGSWLNKPIKTVTDLFSLFEDCTEFRALDLGSGVGRNSIAIAKQFQDMSCRVDCVDILELAIEKLLENAKRFGAEECIHGVISPIEEFQIVPKTYDLILAVSALEHIDSKEAFVWKLEEMQEILQKTFAGWEVLKTTVRGQNYDIPREGCISELSTNVVTFVVKR